MASRTERAFAAPASLGASVVLGASIVAWKFGEGDVVVLAFERSVLGVLLLAAVLVRTVRDGTVRRLSRSPSAVAAILVQGCAGVLGASFFRLVPGPQIAVVVAVLPALLLLPAHLVGRRPGRRAVGWILVCVAAAVAAALSGGLGVVTPLSALLAGLFLATEVVMTLCAERARREFDAPTLVVWGLAATTVGAGAVLVAAPSGTTWVFAWSGFAVALAVALLGTAGRVLRDFALPHLGSAVSYSTSQVMALVVAVGGVLLLDEQLGVAAAALALLAALASVLAVRARAQREDG